MENAKVLRMKDILFWEMFGKEREKYDQTKA